MTSKCLFVILLSLFVVNSFESYAQNGDQLKFSPEHPVSGDELNISYQPISAMKDAKKIKAIIYTFNNNFEWGAKEIDLSPSGKDWKGVFQIPEESGFLAFKFVADTIVDTNNGETYVSMLRKKDGRLAPGAYIAWGLLRAPKYGNQIPEYISQKAVGISDSAMYHWVDMEVQNRRESNIPASYLFVQTARNAHIANAEKRGAKVMSFLLSEGSENALIQAQKIAVMEGRTDQADSILRAIEIKYPKGKFALRNKMREVFSERDMTKKQSGLLELINNYPVNTETEIYLNGFSQNYSSIYQTLLLIDAVNKRYDNISTYVPQMSFESIIGLFYKIVGVPHMRKDIPDAELLPYAQIMVREAEGKLSNKPYSYRFLTDQQWKEQAEKMLHSSIYETYVNILKNTDNKQEALKYAWTAQKTLDYTSAPLNEDMAQMLSENKDNQNLRSVLEKSVYKNKMSEDMQNMLKALYKESHGSYEGYEAYYQGLKNPSDKSELLADIEKYKVTGKMPEWKLTDATGKVISSEELKGKVYVLDFWASWCVPCKASFPGMKMAVEHYKDQKDVVFYFVDTQETSANYKTMATSYIEKNDFPFHLLFDNKKAGSKMNDELVSKIMSSYTTSGIPLKLVIDKTGNIRFLSIGYKGSPSGLADEIIEMVEQAKL
ncbi:TlpA family protein disulfide reductase [Dysgonomonas capnocytophagoides]|uniref:TlpA family protein disulfide reductase n=1 Tax=Dysgonomonas capnocytophagoides TaxID=45254 RepID=UPI0033412083